MAKDTTALNTQSMNKVSVTRQSHGKLEISNVGSVTSRVAPNGSFVIQRGKSNVIIQCPNCQTKFSVSSETISEIEMPRFHCSRCDNVFDMEPTKADNSKAPAPVPVSPAAISAPAGEIEERLKPEVLQKAFQSMLIDETKKSPSEQAASRRDESGQPPAQKEPPLRSLQIPKEITPRFASSAPHEIASKESAFTQDPTQISMPFPAAESPAETKNDMPYGISFGSTSEKENVRNDFVSSLDPVAESALNLDPTDLSRSAFVQEPSASSAAYALGKGKRNATKDVMYFVTPILGMLFLLSALTYVLIKSPGSAEAFASNLSTSLPKFAPPGLRVEDIRFEKVVLDSGDAIHVVAGKLRNDSDEKFSEILVEGLAFDSKGLLLASSKINPASILANSNMKSLTVDMLKNAQASKPSKKFALPAGTVQEFIIPFLNEKDLNKSLDKAAYFSARIYSVRN